jgi:hypothetical protein
LQDPGGVDKGDELSELPLTRARQLTRVRSGCIVSSSEDEGDEEEAARGSSSSPVADAAEAEALRLLAQEESCAREALDHFCELAHDLKKRVEVTVENIKLRLAHLRPAAAEHLVALADEYNSSAGGGGSGSGSGSGKAARQGGGGGGGGGQQQAKAVPAARKLVPAECLLLEKAERYLAAMVDPSKQGLVLSSTTSVQLATSAATATAAAPPRPDAGGNSGGKDCVRDCDDSSSSSSEEEEQSWCRLYTHSEELPDIPDFLTDASSVRWEQMIVVPSTWACSPRPGACGGQ